MGLQRWHDGTPVRSRVGILIRVLLFWIVWFAAGRALFVFWFRDMIPADGAALVVRSFLVGARMDLSAAAYLTAVPWLILVFTIGAVCGAALPLKAGFRTGFSDMCGEGCGGVRS